MTDNRLAEPAAHTAPGRSCPLHYRCAPTSFARAAEAECETLYVVGGLYGNESAPGSVLEMFDRETGRKRLVFNGDFNGFDVAPASFEAINRGVHGDAESLAGWGFAQESLQARAHRQRVRAWFDAAQVDVFASSHTCAPVFHALPMAGRPLAPLVLNNGAAGMPNFRNDLAGLLTRISVRPFRGRERRYGDVRGAVHLDAIAIEIDSPTWQQSFLRQWPPGSDAHTSYSQRITHGPACEPADALVTSEA